MNKQKKYPMFVPVSNSIVLSSFDDDERKFHRMFDLLIINGKIVDGTGKKGCSADIAVSGNKIIKIGKFDPSCAMKTIDAAGMVVTPGFIDIHRHADAALFRPGFGEAELAQGLTTIINGNCGLSISPFGEERRDAILHYLQPVLGDVDPNIETSSLNGYYSSIPPIPINVGMLAGAGTIRTDLCGYDATVLTSEQINSISNAIENVLSDGAYGVSLGLGYAPECFYSTKELIRVLEPFRDGIIPVTVHMRQEGDGVIKSVEEMITVSKALNCPVHISHLKAMGRKNWQKNIPKILAMIDRANDSGSKIDFDVYPYTAGSTQLMIVMPPEFLIGGPEALSDRLKNRSTRNDLDERLNMGTDFDNIVQLAGWDGIYVTSVYTDENRRYCGKSLVEIAGIRNCSPLDACCDLLVEEQGRVTMIDFMADETDIGSILKHPRSNLISDATYPTSGLPHPRVYGTFSRLIERYIVQKRLLTIEEGIRKMTAAPASVLHLNNKGVLAENMDADICIFDPSKIKETADYNNPVSLSTGMYKVIVNGKIAFEDDRMTGSYSGSVLRR